MFIFTIYSFYAIMSYFTPYFTDVLGVTVVFSGIVTIIRTCGMTLAGAPIAGILTDKLKSTSKVLIEVEIIGLIVLLNLNKFVSPVFLIVLTFVMLFVIYVGRCSYYVVKSEVNIPLNVLLLLLGWQLC